MARQPYAPDQNIHSMTTRQLRQYVADQAAEAEKRLKSIDPEDASRAFRDALSDITYKNGKIKKSTSNASKEEMREMAYNLRQFNSLDTESGFAKSIKWKENKQRYESFIRNQIDQGNTYWEKYITKKGNVSKRGFKEYEDYINFIKSIEDVKLPYGYRTLLQYAEQELQMKEPNLKSLSNIINDIYVESRGKGYTQGQLNEALANAINENKAKKPKITVPKVSAKKPKKSKSNIKTVKSRKMREHGTVHGRIT